MQYSGSRHFLPDKWATLLSDVYMEIGNFPPDEFRDDIEVALKNMKTIIMDLKYNIVLDFILFILRHDLCSPDVPSKIQEVFEDTLFAYKLEGPPITIVPRASPEEGATVERALQELSKHGMSGARRHLLKAGELLSTADFSGSVRESIHAVESVARTLDDNSSASLKPALDALEAKGVKLHGAFKKALERLYGYTSDKNGVRHAYLNDDDDVDVDEALFMFGACASFVTYLVSKAGQT